MRMLKLWPVALGVALVMLFVSLERTPPVRASFMLDGLIDCGRSSGQQCSFGDTLVLLTRDSGAPTRYTINISWLKPADLDDFEQDDQVKIEIEKLPDGTLMALRIITNDNNGIANAGTRGAKSTTTTTEDDNDTASCVDTSTTLSTGTLTLTTTTTIPGGASTDTTTVTTVLTSTVFEAGALAPLDGQGLANVPTDARLGDGSRVVRIAVFQACRDTTSTTADTVVTNFSSELSFSTTLTFTATVTNTIVTTLID